MASQGPNVPGTVTQSGNAPENAEAWVNPNNLLADDGTETTITAATFDSPDISNRIAPHNFGFSIPATATIDGIVVDIERRCGAGSASDNRVQLRKTAAGGPIGTNKADTALAWPASLTVKTYGGAADSWGASWTPAEVNATEFGVVISVQADSANTDVQMDVVKVTVHYTDTNRDGTFSVTGGGVLTAVQATNRNRSGSLVGGGILALAKATARNLAQLLTGGGVLVVAGSASSGAENHDATFVLTGGGVLVVAASEGATRAAILTGGGVINWAELTGRLAAVQLTGGGQLVIMGGQDVALSDLGAVMCAIGDALEAADVGGGRVFCYPPDSIDAPACVVGYPSVIEFDATMQRGADRLVIPVYFLTGRTSDRAAQQRIAGVITGAAGVKDAVDGNLGGAVDTARVQDMRVLRVDLAGVEYLSAVFNVEAYV